MLPVALSVARRRIELSLVGLAIVLVGVVRSAPARAESSGGDVSFYISDQFKTVAKRIAVQIGAAEIERACPANKPLCNQVATGVAKAFSSAVSGDKTALKGSLNDFLVTSSVAAALSTSLGSIIPADASKTVIRGTSPLVQCVAGRLSGKRVSGSCKLSDSDRAYITLLFKELVSQLSPNDKAAVLVAWNQVLHEKRVEPSVALRALAGLTSTDKFNRPDLRIYLLSLTDWSKQGFANGLFDATYAYLVDLNNDVATQTAAKDLAAGDYTAWNFWSAAGDASIQAGIGPCSDAMARFAAWQGVRSSTLSGWRASLLQGRWLDLSPLQQLETMPRCQDAAGSKAVEKLRKNVRYVRSALSVEQATLQFGTAALAATMLIDYIRNHDDSQLEHNLRALLLYSTARFALFVVNRELPAPAVPPAPPPFASLVDVLRSCEYQTLALDFGVAVPRGSSPNNCVALFDKGVHPAPTKATPVTAVDVQKTLASLKAILQPLVPHAGYFGRVASDTHLAELANAVEQLARDNKAGAQRTLVRLGIDVLVVSVDQMSNDLFGVDEAICKSDARSRSIFTGLGAGCAAHLLLQAAYHPIADWYWDKGTNADDLPGVADSVYRELLASPYLDTTPVIFNVGLGANYVLGPEATWGGRGYGALTLLDKLGLTFYRRDWGPFRFETGPFVGGFLDALVRTAANIGEERRYWLLGYTAGLPKMWSADFGVELHAAAVMPFDLGSSKHYGFAMGGALVVPFNFVFQGDENGE